MAGLLTLPALSAAFPYRWVDTVAYPAKRVPVLMVKTGGITAAGPYRILTGFPYYAFAGTIKLCLRFFLELYLKFGQFCQYQNA